MELDSLSDLEDYEVSTQSMCESLRIHGQTEVLRAVALLNPDKVTRRCIHVANVVNRFELTAQQVEDIFKTALQFDNKEALV